MPWLAVKLDVVLAKRFVPVWGGELAYICSELTEWFCCQGQDHRL